MAAFSKPAQSSPSEAQQPGGPARSGHAVSLLMLLSMAVAAVALPGCRGCLPEDPLARLKREEEEKKKKQEKPKPDFEIQRPLIMPFDATTQQQQFVKQGHWVTAVQAMKANNFDFQAELESTCLRFNGEPIEIPHTAYRLMTTRPAALPRGQQKLLETMHFLIPPPRPSDALGAAPRVSVETRLRARRGGREVAYGREPTTTMPAYQYFLVVLSDNADNYGNLKLLATVMPPVDDDQDQMLDTIAHYRVLLPKADGLIPVPIQPLAWTSIAHVIWDGLAPDRLTPSQQQSLLDWLHWGGQLVISGPRSLDPLRGSFLDSYLPAEAGAAISLGPQQLEPLDRNWSVANDRSGEVARLGVTQERPLVGVELLPRPGALPLTGTGDLVFERPVGGGRIVVTAFSLADRQIKNWGSFDSFLNSGLLRRPHRRFFLDPNSQLVQVEWVDYPGQSRQLDPNFVTGLRYFTRDVPTLAPTESGPITRSGSADPGSWNDGSGASDAARAALADAAGISIPRGDFVLRALAVYLLLLVPVNWAIFRALGRVEWAWVAAPLIAIGGSLAVVRMAQLDIGFASSRTEVAVLELRPGYPRGHLTRYTALYTSLSTGYDLRFEDESALALPFPRDLHWTRGPLDPVQTVRLRRQRDLSLSDFQVMSNSTGQVHSEQMFDVGGTLELAGDAQQGWTIRNGTALALQDAGLVRRDPQGQVEIGWIGGLEPGGSTRVKFTAAADQRQPLLSQWAESPVASSYHRQHQDLLAQLDSDGDKRLSLEEVKQREELAQQFGAADANRDRVLDERELYAWCIASREGELVMGRLMELACQQWLLPDGTVRLVAWTDDELAGMSIHPRPAQNRSRTMVLADLHRGLLPPARPDVNLKTPYDRPVDVPLDEPAGAIE